MMQVTTRIELSHREEAFVIALAKGMKPTRAAIAAGYSIATARPLMQKQHVSAAIRHCAANLTDACRRIDEGANAPTAAEEAVGRRPTGRPRRAAE